MFFSKLVQKWRNVTYFKKFSVLFYLLFTIFIVFTIITTVTLISILREQEYKTNQDNISTIADKIGQRTTSLEFFTYKIIDNNDIQRLLTDLNTGTFSLLEESQKVQDLRNEIYYLSSYEQHVNTFYIYNADGESMENPTHDNLTFFDSLSTARIMQELGDLPGRPMWFISSDGNRSILARNIFSKDDVEKLGVIIISLDTSFIVNMIESTNLYADTDYFAVEYTNDIYPLGGALPQDIEDYLKSDSTTGNSIERIAGTHYFIARSPIQNTNMRMIGVIPQNKVLEEIIVLEIIIVVLFVLLLVIVWFISQRAIRSLLSPINHLAQKMSSFDKETHEVGMLLNESDSEMNDRSDEIGTLYASFDNLIYTINDLIQENYQAKILNQEMQFQTLQSQLDPHFLYNTLDSINWLAVNNDQHELAEMVASLAQLFRLKLSSENAFHTVSEELQLIEAYLTIQKFRFGDRLRYSQDVDHEVMETPIPRLTIQPLIENALKYAVERMNEPCHVSLNIYLENSILYIVVKDSGPGFKNSKMKNKHSTGIGIKNIQERIKLYYSGKGNLTITSIPFQETTVLITLPVKGGEIQ